MARSAATTTAAATGSGPDPAGQPPEAAERQTQGGADQPGTSRRSTGPGGRAPPKGVRKDNAARTSLLPARRRATGAGSRASTRPATTSSTSVGDVRHGPVDRPEGVAKLAAGLAGGMDPQTHFVGDHHRRCRAGLAGRRTGPRRRRRTRGCRPPRCRGRRPRRCPSTPARASTRPAPASTVRQLGRPPSAVGRNPGRELGIGSRRGRSPRWRRRRPAGAGSAASRSASSDLPLRAPPSTRVILGPAVANVLASLRIDRG